MQLATSAGTLLGGRVRHAQPCQGHRSGLEPVLLAAAIPARAGARVLEGGTGAGSALLCLAARVAGITGVGIERDAAMADLARRNLAENDCVGLAIETADLTSWRGVGGFDHAFANPPWHTEAATASPDVRRDAARRASPALLEAWARALAAALRHRGTLTLILGADHLAGGLAAVAAAGCGSPTILPLWAKAGRPARLVLLQAIRGGRGPSRVMPGLVLHEANGGFTAAAEAILRDGQALAV